MTTSVGRIRLDEVIPDGVKYILEDIPVVLAKANQALATLDKFRTRLDQVSTRLTALEFEGGATLHDVLTVLQRSELVTRMAVEIERYIVELGSEGRLIEMQLEETMVGAAAEKAALVRDYLSSYSDEAFAAALEEIGRLAHQDLLDFGRLAELLGYDRKLNTLDYPVAPRGYRVLGRIPRLPKLVVTSIVTEYVDTPALTIEKIGGNISSGFLVQVYPPETGDSADVNRLVFGMKEGQRYVRSMRLPEFGLTMDFTLPDKLAHPGKQLARAETEPAPMPEK